MASRRSISDIVAVIMLVIIAIAAAAIIYAWLSGFIGGLRSSSGSVASVKLQITGASASVSDNEYYVTVYLYNPTGSSPTTISQAILEFANGTVIASSSDISFISGGSAVTASATSITPNEAATASITFSFSASPPSIPAGTPVQIVVYTPSGYSTSYQFSWP